MKIIGLTGGISSGKSTVSNELIRRGFRVIDADIVARKVVEKGMPAIKEIEAFFGREILMDDGTLNRKKLASMIFSDESKRQRLNQITHPRIREWIINEIKEEQQNGEEVVFLDIPLLFESQAFQLAEQVLVVYVDEKTQLERLMKRDKLSKEQALERIHSQMPMEEKKKRADYLIQNTGSYEETYQQLNDVLRKLNVRPKSRELQ